MSSASLSSLFFPHLYLNYHRCPSLFSLLPSLFLPTHSHLSKINRSSRITLPPSPTPNSPPNTHIHVWEKVRARERVREPETEGDGGWRVGNWGIWMHGWSAHLTHHIILALCFITLNWDTRHSVKHTHTHTYTQTPSHIILSTHLSWTAGLP